MRLKVIVACVLGISLAGCYHPSVKNKGFACTADNPYCPAGFYCVDGLCQDTPGPGVGGVGGDDMAGGGGSGGMSGSGGHGGSGGGGTGGAGGMSAVDMAQAPVDMTQVGPDMAQCTLGKKDDACNTTADCCAPNTCQFVLLQLGFYCEP